MAKGKPPASKHSLALREVALRHADVVEGVACEGTVIEKRTLKVDGKAFLFLGPGDAMLKLAESAAEAARLSQDEPGRYRIGSGGWTKITFGPDAPPDLAVLARWIAESYRQYAGADAATASKGAARKPKPTAKKT